ncbi:MAG: AtpZ/AtpI family protein [Bacteroidota bacterium]|nr:AtpZ/AtpI family protein [Bacteroidota bacterium]
MKKQPSSNNRLLFQYAGLATQLLVSLAIAVYAGYWVDKKIGWNIPLLVWILPLLVVISIIVKTVKDTSKK